MRKFVGYDQDGKKIEVEKVHNACFLVHCEHNTQSPFEFSSEKEVLEFISFIQEPPKKSV